MKDENGNEIVEKEEVNDPNKTGYEDTGENDTFGEIEIEKNVETPGEKSELSDKEKAKLKDSEKSNKESLTEKELQEKADEFIAEQEKEAEKLSKEIEAELPDGEKKKKKEDNTEKKQVPKLDEDGKEVLDDNGKQIMVDEKEPDMFDTDKLEEDLKTETDVKKITETVNWEDVSKSIKLPDDLKIVPKENTLEGFKAAVKLSIESAKQKTEFDLESFEAPQKEIINYFMNKGTIEDLLSPLKEIDDALIQSPETKVTEFLMEAEKLSKEDAEAKINDMIEAETFDAKVKDIDNRLLNLRDQRFKEIVSKKSDANDVLLENKKQENKEMNSYVDEMKSFMGVKLPDNVKSYIKKEIDAGKLAKMNNNAEAQVLARLFMLYGTNILKKINEGVKNASRDGYNKGLKKEIDKIHNIPPKEKAKSAIEQQKQSSITNPLALFENMDDDSISME